MKSKWDHALERMRERHDPNATINDVKSLVEPCSRIVLAWQAGKRIPEVGAVLQYQGTDALKVRVRWQEQWLNVVYVPRHQLIRTVLPS